MPKRCALWHVLPSSKEEFSYERLGADRCTMDTGSEDVVEVIIGQMDNNCDIHGVKAGLQSNTSKMSELDFHKLYRHLGFCPRCKV